MNQEEFIERLSKACDLQKEFEKMSNVELAKLLVEKVWARIDLFTYDSVFVEAVIDRLMNMKE